ncbi:MAG: helix-turn-helix transcriptional regulator [Geminicoccaceae bacterium]
MIMPPTSSTSERFASRPELDTADVEYFRQRNRERLYAAVMSVVAECIEDGNLTKADIARIIGKDPAQITKWFGGPANLTLDTISLLLLSCGAEMDYYPVYLGARGLRNDEHDLVHKLEAGAPSAIILREDKIVKSSVPTTTSGRIDVKVSLGGE